MSPRIKTGIPGFDKLIQGGFVENSVNLISGSAGTGKSIFSMQYLFNGIKAKESGIYITLEQEIEDLKKDAEQFGWNFEEQDFIRFYYSLPYELGNLQAKIEELVKKNKAKRIVIDSVSNFALALENDYEVRKEIYSLAIMLKKLGCTSVLTSEITSDLTGQTERVSRYGVEEFVCDSVTTLHYAGLGGVSDRAIRVIKMRRTDHVQGPVAMQITKKGIRVMKKDI